MDECQESWHSSGLTPIACSVVNGNDVDDGIRRQPFFR